MAHQAPQLSHLTLSHPPLACHAPSTSHFRPVLPGLPASHMSLPCPPHQTTTHSLQSYPGLPLRAFPRGSRIPFIRMFYTVTVLPSDHVLPTGPTTKAVSSLLWSLSIQSLATSQSRNVCWKNKRTNQWTLLAGVVPPSTRRREKRTDKPVRG